MLKHMDSYAVMNTQDIEKMQSVLFTMYDARSFDVVDEEDFSAQAAMITLGASSLSYCSYAGTTRVGFRDDDYLRFQFALNGHGRTMFGGANANANKSNVVYSPAEADLEFSRNFEQFTVRVSKSALIDDVRRLTGRSPKGHLPFRIETNTSQYGHAARLRDLVLRTASSIDLSPEPIPAPILREIDQTIRYSILFAVADDTGLISAGGDKTTAPWQVHRIEEWIEANWKSDVTVDKLVDISGASARSIFATFKRARGYSPMAYLKTVRLDAAHKLLMAAEPGCSVTAIAFACNFLNPGHFARDYQRQFGELPSETLSRRKVRCN